MTRTFDRWTTRLLCLALIVLSASATAADFDTALPMQRSSTGNYLVNGVLDGNVEAAFLVDTGSGLVTLDREVFARVSRAGRVEKIGRRAARLANGSHQAFTLWRVEGLRLGEHCELGPIEVAVLGRGGRNILGLSALSRVAPFAMDLSASPALLVSACGLPQELLAQQ